VKSNKQRKQTERERRQRWKKLRKRTGYTKAYMAKVEACCPKYL